MKVNSKRIRSCQGIIVFFSTIIVGMVGGISGQVLHQLILSYSVPTMSGRKIDRHFSFYFLLVFFIFLKKWNRFDEC